VVWEDGGGDPASYPMTHRVVIGEPRDRFMCISAMKTKRSTIGFPVILSNPDCMQKRMNELTSMVVPVP
jgi:hypothetical protein